MKKFITTVALAGILAFTGSASAQTSGDLQAQIDALLAQLAAMQGTTTTVTGPAFVFSGTMRPGMSGPGVSTLQASLNSVQDPDLVVDGAYGPATAAAVKQFQASQGLAIDGIVGPMTGAALTAASTTTIIVGTDGDLPEGCTSTAGYSPVTGEKCDAEGSSNNGGFPTTGGDEASLEKFSFDSEDDAEEGEMKHVATIEFDVEDGDAMIERLDLSFFTATATEDEPWDAFDTLTLMVDGDEIASEDISDEDDWNDDDSNGSASDPFVFRLTGLDYVVEEGDTAEIEVYLTAANNVDGAGTASDWTIFVDEDGIRAVDTAGLTQEIGDASETVTFEIDEEGGDESIDIQSSSNDPDATSLLVDEDDRSDWHEVFIFELEAEESDIELDELVIDVLTGTANYEDVVNDVMIEIDGEEFDDFDVATGTAASTAARLSFDIDGDYTIDADETVDVSVWVEFKRQGDGDGTVTGDGDDNYDDGETIQIRTFSVDGEGKDDVSDNGVVTGEEHTLSVTGAEISDLTSDSDQNEAGTVGTFVFEFTVNAEEGDVDVTDTNTTHTLLGPALGAGTMTATLVDLDGDATANGANDFTVSEGDSVTFSYTVVVDPASAGNYYVRLDRAAGVAQNKTAGPETLVAA